MKEYLDMLAQAETKYGLPAGLLQAQMVAESNGDPMAKSPKGAVGLMQFMPATAAELGIDPSDPVQSIDGAGRYMSRLMKSTGNVRDAVAAYNWGIGNVKRKGVNNAPPETRDYIAKVSTRMKQFANGMAPIQAANASDEYVSDPALLEQLNAQDEYVSDPELLKQLNAPEPAKPAAQPKQRTFMEGLGRQFGLAGRDIIEGGASTIGILSNPLAAASNAAFGTEIPFAEQTGEGIADAIGLPKPENATERIVNEGAKFLVGTGGFVKGGQAASKVAEGGLRKGLEMIAAKPGMQAASAAGAGTAGQAAKEDGSGFGGQLGATVLGGVLAPAAVSTVKAGANAVGNFVKSITPQRIDQVLTQASIDLSKLPQEIANTLRADVAQALKVGDDVSPDKLRRLADYRMVGATPMRSNLSLDPVQITQDRNLAKIAANSKDPVAQQLARVQRENNDTLIGGLNRLGADALDDSYTAGQKVIGALEGRNNQVKGVINTLYDKARNTAGRDAELDPSYFTNRFNDLIDFNNLGDVLSTKYGGLVNKLNNIAQGKTPLTVDVAEQLKTSIGKIQRNEADGNVRTALGFIRQSLDETPLIQGQNMGQGSIDAFNVARKVNAKWMGIVEKTPALQAIRDGVEPDQFVKKYIIGANNSTKDLEMLKRVVKSAPEANEVIRGQIAAHLKGVALNRSADEVGTFSQKAYNKALADIGKQKLSVFFTPQEIEQLRAIGRVASYETFQGAGTAVNNSNTASAAFGNMLDKVINSNVVRSKIPFASLLANPVQDQIMASGARNALNAPKQIALPRAKVKGGSVVPFGAVPFLTEQESN